MRPTSILATVLFLAACAVDPASSGLGSGGGKADDDIADPSDVKSPATRRNLESWSCRTDGQATPVAFFDADSTLRVSRIDGKVTATATDDVNVLPMAATRIAQLNGAGYLIAIVSNQGGVSSGNTTYEVAEGALAFTASQLGRLGARIDYFDFAEAYDENRKPQTGMATRLDAALTEECGAGMDLSRSFMVGDSGYKKDEDGPHPDGRPADDFSNADRGFAENLGVPFHEPTDYFGWRNFGVFNIASQTELIELHEAIEREADRNREINGL
jgi:bifunctional polynucleotide phosphatase/kinase